MNQDLKWMGIGLAMFFGVPVVGIVLIFTYFAAWSYSGIFYSGDGEYRRGTDGAAWQVRFPAIDVTRTGRYVFHFSHLAPPVGYCAGFRVDGARHPAAIIAMTMQDNSGTTVFAQKQRAAGCSAYFTPHWSERYTLIVEVVDPDPSAASLRVNPVINGYTSGL